VKEARGVLAPSQALDDQIEGAYSEHFAPRWTPLVAEKVLTRNVASFAKPTRPRQHQFQTWSVAEATTSLAAIREHRLYALFAVAIALGMRRGDALGLRGQDVDLVEGTITMASSCSEWPANSGTTRRRPATPLAWSHSPDHAYEHCGSTERSKRQTG
jgi:integrase